MELAVKSEQLLGTIIEIKIPEQRFSLFSKCFSEIKRIESTYSRFVESSELSRANRKLGVWQDTSEEFVWLLGMAEDFRKKTDGNFDITLKSVLDEMGYDKDYSFKPKISNKKDRTGVTGQNHGIKIDAQNKRVLLEKEVDFGGLGKGFALDKVREILETNGVFHYYINAGGDIFARQGDGEEPWVILLEHPDDPAMAIGKVMIDNCSIAGSAPNRRKWGEFHHLINAKTKKPATGVKATFVVAKTGIEADAYATAIFTAGFVEGIRLSNQLPVEILSISDQNKIFKTENFKVDFF